MYECIKYRLNPDGTIPKFLCLDPNGVNGMFGAPSPGTTQHDDTVLIGLSNPGAAGGFEVVPTQQMLQDYLAEVGAGWREPVNDNDLTGPTKPFDPVAAAQWVWERKLVLSAT